MPVFLPGESHGRRILVDPSSWGRTESDMTERLHFDFHALIITLKSQCFKKIILARVLFFKFIFSLRIIALQYFVGFWHTSN